MKMFEVDIRLNFYTRSKIIFKITKFVSINKI